MLGILQAQTARDKQVSIGASNLSNGCTLCLARQMVAGQQSDINEGMYWLGAKLGTAVHEYLDEHNPHPDLVNGEKRVIIGDIEGYGTVGSTTDAYFTESEICADWKTTTREKLKWIKLAIADEPNEYEVTKVREARFKLAAYQRQVWLYAKGLRNAGKTVTGCAIVFICRDGLNENDIWEWTFPFDEAKAEEAWNRGVRLWTWIQDGGNVEDLKPHPQCWPCSNKRGR